MQESVIVRAFLFASWCARHVPLRLAYAVAAAGGWVAYYTWPRGRKNTVANLSHVLTGATPRHIRRMARASMANYGRYLVDFLRVPGLSAARAVALVEGEADFAAFARAREEGRGVLVVSFHFGNWDLGAAATAGRGHPLTVVAETFSSPGLNRFVVASRERLGMRVVPMERAGPSLVRALKRNEALALLADRPLAEGGVRIPFFGAEVEVPAGPARLAMAANSLIMPVAFVRLSPWSDRARGLAAQPFPPLQSGDAEDDVRATMAALFAAYEGFIRARPDQWYMFRRMWREDSGAC